MVYGYEEFKKDVYKMTDINLDLYKERQMKRRIESLISRCDYNDYESFIKGMRQDKDLLRTFVSYLTINVSQFYRNPNQWETLKSEMIPYLLEHFGKRITIWSAACSTGDEPYTIAMILSEFVDLSNIKIIATDIDDDVLAFAKKGIYNAKSLTDLPSKYIDKFFHKIDNSNYEICDEIKKCVTFQKHNLLKDRFFRDIDMVVCRNVVIYFTDVARDSVYNKFHESLKDEGILFIGNTEQILRAREMGFEPVRTFFYKKTTAK